MSQEPKPRLYAQTTKRTDLSSSGEMCVVGLGEKKERLTAMSNQVDSEGTRIIGVEPVSDRPDHRHRWWDPIEGTSPLPDEEAKIKDWRAAQFRAARRRRCRSRPRRCPPTGDQRAARKGDWGLRPPVKGGD